MRFVPIIDLPILTTGVWRRLGVHVFEGHVSVDDMAKLEVAGERWHERMPGQLVEMTIIYPSDTRMTSDERARMTRLIKRWAHTRTASATVILATGMTGAMHRSVLTAMMMLAPAPHPARVFSTIPAAVKWLVPYVAALSGDEATHGAVLAAVEQLCVQFRAKRDALAAQATS